MRTFLFFITLILTALSSTSFAATVKKTAVVMGTDFEMTVVVDDVVMGEKAFDAAISEMRRIEEEMSEWIPGSPVSKINKDAGIMPVKVSNELFKVIAAAQEVSRLTEGAFDITWAGTRGLWDFTKGKERVPTDEEVKKTRANVDYRFIELDPDKLTVFLKKRGVAIGLGAIAKGYAVDKAMQAVAALGIKNVILKAGGDMRVQGGDTLDGWKIGIKHPREKGRLIAKLELKDISISTSGDYERFFIKDGVLYHHIIDPSTGYPAKGVMSVTVIAPDTMTSDALSTAVFVLGPIKGMALVKRLKGVEAVIVDSDGRIAASAGVLINRE
ncbi:MAG: FAD:protein FMN transferase [Deltaproteobacteria bacterium]|nr:FAD:protein FMN transferase [Deltaproteobacteria bacterium]